jgi:hypothetical protein
LQAERDAANRERDAAVAESERRLRLCETMKRDGDSARFHAAVAQARVAELEEARKRFDTALEEARDASGINDFIVQRDEAFDERDAAIRERDQIRENARADHNIAKAACDERDAAIRERESWKLLADRTNERLSAAEARVAELKKRSSFLSQHKEAYAYETMLDGWEIGSREWAEAEPELHWIKLTAPENDAAGGGLEVKPAASGSGEGEPYMVTASGIPLYRAPPPPRGWLTEEERDLIAWIVDEDAYTEKAQSIAKGLLARSTPPEVVKPSRSMYTVSSPYAHGWDECDRAYRSAIAAAGVAVKEVT